MIVQHIKQNEEVREIGIVIACLLIAFITSVITTKVLAIHYFEIVDGYVEDICIKTKEFVESVEDKL